MGFTQTKYALKSHRGGSALIAVVVLTVLLAAIGILFLLATRLDEMATSSVVRSHELDCAVESVVELISQRLTDDITDSAQWPLDYPSLDDRRGDLWLGTVEPRLIYRNTATPETYRNDTFQWRQLSDITGQLFQGGVVSDYAFIYMPADANDLLLADADGDGVTDSRWTRLPDIMTGRGEPVFAAVRIIDNCAMLNLNTAFPGVDSVDVFGNLQILWPDTGGRALSSVDYRRFLVGSDRTPIGAAPPAVRDFSDPYSIVRARRTDGLFVLPVDSQAYYNELMLYHQFVAMNIENPGYALSLYDISDELEIRNRFFLTSPFEARFERHDISNFTFDAGGSLYGVLSVPVETAAQFDGWKWRLDPNNFDNRSGAYADVNVDYNWRYDRRHVCTFYSFDRSLRTGYYPEFDVARNPVTMIFDPDPVAVGTDAIKVTDPLVEPDPAIRFQQRVRVREQILRLLYAFRAYFLVKYESQGEDYQDAARRAAQLVANMIDYMDDNNPTTEGPFFDLGQTNDNPTFINRVIVNQLISEVSGGSPQYDFGLGVENPDETVYGYERQPFITEICRYNFGALTFYGIELYNPYDTDISLDFWRIKANTFEHIFLPNESAVVSARSRLVLTSDVMLPVMGGAASIVIDAPTQLSIPDGAIVQLDRPDPLDATKFITVDKTRDVQAGWINAPINESRTSKRDDKRWKFANLDSFVNERGNGNVNMGAANNVDSPRDGWQMPVADDNVPIGTLLDFEMVLTIGNDPNGTGVTVTEEIAGAMDERDVRNDVVPRSPGFLRAPVSVLDYVCFMSRPEGSLSGRININTATKEVIRAAIQPNPNPAWNPDYEALAASIVARREQGQPFGNPYRRISDLLNVPGFDQFDDPNDKNSVGDPDMGSDIEERDWILSTVANIFTVRSDVFTAYILVRLGHDGPERRMIAIFNRSNVYKPAPGSGQRPEKPKLVALHPVPDPR